jgi:hypothetical protein
LRRSPVHVENWSKADFFALHFSFEVLNALETEMRIRKTTFQY